MINVSEDEKRKKISLARLSYAVVKSYKFMQIILHFIKIISSCLLLNFHSRIIFCPIIVAGVTSEGIENFLGFSRIL